VRAWKTETASKTNSFGGGFECRRNPLSIPLKASHCFGAGFMERPVDHDFPHRSLQILTDADQTPHKGGANKNGRSSPQWHFRWFTRAFSGTVEETDHGGVMSLAIRPLSYPGGDPGKPTLS
jgi:hypothetical protein